MTGSPTSRNSAVMKNMKRYSSVEALLIGEKMPKRIILKVRELLERDKAIARAFRHGIGMRRLAKRHSLPLLVIEDILRYELVLHSKP